MVRDRAEINPKIAEHLNRLIEEQGIKQTEFAERVGVSVVTANRWVRGKSGLSAYNAEQISRAFPSYSTDYLLGMSDYPNEAIAKLELEKAQYGVVGVLMDAVNDLLQLNDAELWQITPDNLPSKSLIGATLHDMLEYVEANESGFSFVIRRNGEERELSIHQFSVFAQDINDYVGFRLNQLFERGCL